MSLAIAFGARGSGTALAHFEPARNVIQREREIIRFFDIVESNLIETSFRNLFCFIIITCITQTIGY